MFFDIGWSELLIVVVAALVLFGPKELMVVMRTIGRYAGVARRHANEFRSHIDAVMQEAELEAMETELNTMGKGVSQSVDEGVENLNKDVGVQDVAERVVAGERGQTPAVSEEPPRVMPEKADAS